MVFKGEFFLSCIGLLFLYVHVNSLCILSSASLFELNAKDNTASVNLIIHPFIYPLSTGRRVREAGLVVALLMNQLAELLHISREKMK